METQLRGSVLLLTPGPFAEQFHSGRDAMRLRLDEELLLDVTTMVPLAAAFAQHATVSSTLIDALAEAALRSQAALQGEKVRSFFSQLYTSPTRGNNYLNGVLNQGGFLTVGRVRARGA